MNKKLTETLEGGKKVSKGEYVFSGNGKPYRDVKTGWWSALKRSKIEGFRFHDLQHTFGTRLGMNGYDLKTITEIMGIKDPKVAMIYLNPTPEHKRNAVESLNQVTTFFTTADKNPDSHKVVSIGNDEPGRLAQLDRALVSGTKGRGFNSRIARHSSSCRSVYKL